MTYYIFLNCGWYLYSHYSVPRIRPSTKYVTAILHVFFYLVENDGEGQAMFFINFLAGIKNSSIVMYKNNLANLLLWISRDEFKITPAADTAKNIKVNCVWLNKLMLRGCSIVFSTETDCFTMECSFNCQGFHCKNSWALIFRRHTLLCITKFTSEKQPDVSSTISWSVFRGRC